MFYLKILHPGSSLAILGPFLLSGGVISSVRFEKECLYSFHLVQFRYVNCFYFIFNQYIVLGYTLTLVLLRSLRYLFDCC